MKANPQNQANMKNREKDIEKKYQQTKHLDKFVINNMEVDITI